MAGCSARSTSLRPQRGASGLHRGGRDGLDVEDDGPQTSGSATTTRCPSWSADRGDHPRTPRRRCRLSLQAKGRCQAARKEDAERRATRGSAARHRGACGQPRLGAHRRREEDAPGHRRQPAQGEARRRGALPRGQAPLPNTPTTSRWATSPTPPGPAPGQGRRQETH